MSKFYVYITDAEQFLQNRADLFAMNYNLHITNQDGMEEHGWIKLRDVDLNFDVVDLTQATERALKKLDESEKEARARHQVTMDDFEERRGKLLSLPHIEEG